MNELVSVAIPIYNVEAYLERCINSILNQTYNNLEILLIDDGSMDKSPIICDKYASIDKRVRVIHKNNGGLSSARECAISNFNGDYFMVVDADDFIDINTINECMNIINIYNVDCICFSYWKEYEGRGIPVYGVAEEGLYKGKKKKEIYKRLFGPFDKHLIHPEHIDSLSPCWNKLYKMDIIRKARFFDTKYVGSCEDGLLNAYSLYHADSIYFLDRCYYHYCKTNGGSLTSKYKSDLWIKWQNLYKEFMNCINEYKLPSEYIEALNNRFAFSMIGLGLNEISNPNLSMQCSNMRKILNSEPFKKSIKGMDYKYLPFKWKMFIFTCKHKMVLTLRFLLIVINRLRRRS